MNTIQPKANPFDQFGGDTLGIVAQPEVPPSGKNPFEQFGANEPAQPQATQPQAPQPSLYQSVYENPMLGAEQRSVPHPDRYGKPLSTDLFTSDAGEVLFRDPSGNVVPTDMSKHVMLVGPDGRKAVYQRTPETTESPLVGGSRVMSLGLGSGAPTTAAAVARVAPAAEASIPELRTAATSVYRNPEILARTVNPGEVASAFNEVSPELRRFDPEITARLSDRLSGLGSPQGLTINDLNIASERLGEIANETQMTTGGLKSTKAAAAATIVKQKLDGVINKVAPEWAAADRNYSAAEAAQTIVNRGDKATVLARGGDSAARIQTQATQLLANPRNLRGFTPDEIAQLHDMSEGKLKGDALLNAASWLSGKIATVGGIGAGLVGYKSGVGLPGAVGSVVATMAVDPIVQGILTRMGNRLAANQVNTLSAAIRARSPLGQQLAQNAQDWEAARQAMHATPTSMTLTTLANASRELSKALSSVGVKVGPAQLMRGAKPDENQQNIPRPPGQ